MGILHFNHLAVLAAAVLQWIIAVIWYSPVFFGDLWKSAAGVPAEKTGVRTIRALLVCFFGNLAASFVLLHILGWAEADSIKRALLVGLGLWGGLIFAPLAAHYIYENRPFKLYAINTGYWLVALLASSALLMHWI
jgi:hypothetical protein